jgi:hypothetical protein
MERRTKIIGVTATTITATMVILAALGGPVLGANTTVTVQVPTGTFYSGSTFTVPIYCGPGQPIKAFEMKINYNPSVLKVLTVTEGNIFTATNQTFFSPGIIDNVNGNVKNVYDLIIGTGLTSNPGNMILVTFQAVNYGTTSITLTGVGVANNTQYVPITIVNGTVTIYSSYDMNLDKTINLLDLTDVASHYGESGTPGWIKEDINKDGVVRVLDLVLVATHWGPY